MNKHTQYFILLLLAKAVVLPMLFLDSALIGRILGAGGFGQWAMIIAAATIMHNIFFNWTYASGIRFGCEEWLKDGTISRTLAARLPLLITGLLIAIILLAVQPFNWLSLLFSINKNLWWIVGSYAISLWLINELQTTLQISGQMKLLALLSPAITAFFTIFLLLVFLMPHRINMPEWIVAAQIVVTIVVCIGIWSIKQKKKIFDLRAPVYEDVKRHFRFGWSLLPSFLVGNIIMWSNYLILQAYHSSSEVGLFAAAYQVMLGIISLNGVLITIVLPRLIAKNIESKDASINFFNNVTPTLFCLWALVTIAVIAVIPSIFIALFGKQFMGSQSMLIVLSIVIPTSILSYVYDVLFNIQQRLGRELVYSFISMIASLIVSFSLIPVMGGLGAAIGTITALLTTQLLVMRDQHRFMNTPLRRMGILFLATLLFCIFQYVIGPDLWARLIWGAASICFLIILFRRLKVINSNLLNTIFSGHMSGIGKFLNKVLVA